MRVLVAGDRGCIGTVLVPFLGAAGHHVDGLNLGLDEGCDLGPNHKASACGYRVTSETSGSASWSAMKRWPAWRRCRMTRSVT